MTVTVGLVHAPSTIYLTTTVRMGATFRTFDGNVADPGTIVLRHQDPSGNIATSTYPAAGWTHPSTGVYGFDLDTDEAGAWHYSMAGTGAVDSYSEGEFVVHAKEF